MVKLWFNGDFNRGLMVFNGSYPLVNVYSLLWKDPPFLLGKFSVING